jgi:zona occludens toxin (predicted ATPase)
LAAGAHTRVAGGTDATPEALGTAADSAAVVTDAVTTIAVATATAEVRPRTSPPRGSSVGDDRDRDPPNICIRDEATVNACFNVIHAKSPPYSWPNAFADVGRLAVLDADELKLGGAGSRRPHADPSGPVGRSG